MTELELTINGTPRQLHIDVRTTLLDLLREDLGLTGTKKGCDHGQCGACTVMVNGVRINSCLSLAVQHQGDKITTIEGLGTVENLHPMQAAFVKHDGYQCGYCTPGMVMQAAALIAKNADPDDGAIDAAISVQCRCGTYPRVRGAVKMAAAAARGAGTRCGPHQLGLSRQRRRACGCGAGLDAGLAGAFRAGTGPAGPSRS